MKLIDRLIELNNGNKFEAECDCPFNYYQGEIPENSFTSYCVEDGSKCEMCLNQELK